METELDFDRIRYLLSPEALAQSHVTLVGVGSVGAPVCDHLTMNGVRRWSLFDPDTLDGVNLVKHPRRRSDLGRPKVDCQRDWIMDRNPDALVDAYQLDVSLSPIFEKVVAESSLVLCCVDQNGIRECINDVCVSRRIPCITAGVFRTGIGGEVYGYFPGKTGCYRCLQSYAEKSQMNMPDHMLEMTAQEKERIYGLGDVEFRASGLSIDIQSVALIQARMALSAMLHGAARFPVLKSNWIIWGNRPARGIFTSHFQSEQRLLRPQKGCACLNG